MYFCRCSRPRAGGGKNLKLGKMTKKNKNLAGKMKKWRPKSKTKSKNLTKKNKNLAGKIIFHRGKWKSDVQNQKPNPKTWPGKIIFYRGNEKTMGETQTNEPNEPVNALPGLRRDYSALRGTVDQDRAKRGVIEAWRSHATGWRIIFRPKRRKLTA